MTEVTDADRLAWGDAWHAWDTDPACSDEKAILRIARHREYGYNAGYYDGRTATEQEIVRQIVVMIEEKYASVIAESIIADIEAGEWKQK